MVRGRDRSASWERRREARKNRRAGPSKFGADGSGDDKKDGRRRKRTSKFTSAPPADGGAERRKQLLENKMVNKLFEQGFVTINKSSIPNGSIKMHDQDAPKTLIEL